MVAAYISAAFFASSFILKQLLYLKMTSVLLLSKPLHNWQLLKDFKNG